MEKLFNVQTTLLRKRFIIFIIVNFCSIKYYTIVCKHFSLDMLISGIYLSRKRI